MPRRQGLEMMDNGIQSIINDLAICGDSNQASEHKREGLLESFTY